ncbi:MAG: hypothetical protein MUF72_19655 [Elainella sp. Prado103]|jgi:hypothetical protein|nr:hypothetical protein [Elainella sp. Prado103]
MNSWQVTGKLLASYWQITGNSPEQSTNFTADPTHSIHFNCEFHGGHENQVKSSP